MSEVVVVAVATAKAGREAEAEALLTGLVQPTHAEDGCIAYALHRDLRQPGRFVFVERWASRETLAAHAASRHLTAFAAAFPEVGTGPEVFVLEGLSLGDPAKGALGGAG